MSKQTKQETSFAYELAKDVAAHAILFVAEGKLTALKDAGVATATKLASQVGSCFKTPTAKTTELSRPECNWNELETPTITRKMGVADFENWQNLSEIEGASIALHAEQDAFILLEGENIEMARY